MKQVVFSLALMFGMVISSMSVWSQTQTLLPLSVDEVTMDSRDLAAKNYPKYDSDGNLYALVKVRPKADALKFSFGMMKCIVDENPHEDETWLYVQKNARHVTVRGEGYKTAEHVDLGHTLEAGATYIMQLSLGQVRQQASRSRYVIFRVDAPKSVVIINGKSLEVNDGGAMTRLSLGKYSYEVSAPKYETSVGQITVEDGEGNIEERVNLTPRFKSVTLTAGDGVEIYVDGVRKGVGQWTGDLEYSSYTLECRKAGHSPTSQDLVVTKEGLSAFTLVSPSPMYGSLDVSVEPLDAEVFLDGKMVGKTPLLLSEILVGSHELKVRKNGYEELSRKIEVKENEEGSLAASLTSLPQAGTQVKESTQVNAAAEGRKPGSATVENNKASSSSSKGTGIHNGHEYVDLGLPSGTLWATCNVGAEKPEDYGDYFAWGETSTKDRYDWSNLKYFIKGKWEKAKFSKYVLTAKYGKVDGRSELDLSDDAARANWGGSWRMPSSAQIGELMRECNTEWTTQGGVYGRKVTSRKNGNSIFLPAAGYRLGSSLYEAGSYGHYWSRSLYESYSIYAYHRYFDSSDFGLRTSYRYYGRSVRPVASE